jgi:hypothetical protein
MMFSQHPQERHVVGASTLRSLPLIRSVRFIDAASSSDAAPGTRPRRLDCSAWFNSVRCRRECNCTLVSKSQRSPKPIQRYRPTTMVHRFNRVQLL